MNRPSNINPPLLIVTIIIQVWFQNLQTVVNNNKYRQWQFQTKYRFVFTLLPMLFSILQCVCIAITTRQMPYTEDLLIYNPEQQDYCGEKSETLRFYYDTAYQSLPTMMPQ